MKVCVIGSSFASTICIIELINQGFKPYLIDSDDDFSSSKIALKKDNKNKIINPIQVLGGLSNFWTGSIHEYLESDFDKWPIKYSNLKDYYKLILNNISAKKFNFKYLLKNKNYNLVNENIFITENKYFSLKYNEILVNKNITDQNKYNQKVFNFREIINNLITTNKINYIPGKVVSYSENNNKVKINIVRKNQSFFCEADYLFLGSGTLSTYNIINKSLSFDPKYIQIKTQQKLLVPIMFNQMKFDINNFENSFPLFQLNLKKKNISSYAQIYCFNRSIINFIFPTLTNLKVFYPFFYFLKKFGFAYFTFGSELCTQFYIQNGRINISNQKHNLTEILKDNKYLFNTSFSNNFFKLLRIYIKRNSLSGNHFGGSFPMSEKYEKYKTSINGNPFGSNRISIIDSSIFPTLSARPPTLTIMANSLRITQNIINKIKSNNF